MRERPFWVFEGVRPRPSTGDDRFERDESCWALSPVGIEPGDRELSFWASVKEEVDHLRSELVPQSPSRCQWYRGRKWRPSFDHSPVDPCGIPSATPWSRDAITQVELLFLAFVTVLFFGSWCAWTPEPVVLETQSLLDCGLVNERWSRRGLLLNRSSSLRRAHFPRLPISSDWIEFRPSLPASDRRGLRCSRELCATHVSITV